MKAISEPYLTAVNLEDLTDGHLEDITLSDEQSKFLDAVRDGDAHGVRLYVLEKHVDVNCANLSGETALQLAVNNDRHVIAKFLLENGAEVGNALLQAVAKDSIEWVRALLDFVKDSENRPASPSIVSSEQQTSRVKYNRFVSPLMLAAHNDNQEMVKLFLAKGFTIEEPPFHNRSCECDECMRLGKRLGTSIYRLQSYRAMASPVYLCMSYLLDKSSDHLVEDQDIASSKDPIVRAFLLNRKLESLVDTEYEFKADYKQLSDNCEEFAVALLTKCRTMEEISCVMEVPGIDQVQHVEVRGGPEAQKLSVLNFAIANGNEKFVAHPYSQLMLNSVLYNRLGGWEDFGFLKKVICSMFLTLLLPVLALFYFLAPNSQVSKMLRKPFFKFVSHAGSFCCFLILLILSSIQDKLFDVLQFTVFDVFLSLWIAGQLLQEAKEALRQGKERYISQYWNLVSLFMLGLFVISGALWLTGFIMTAQGFGDWTIPIGQVFGDKAQVYAYRLLLLSNATFSIGLVLSFINASNFFQVNSILGPLQLSLVKMMRDIAKFLFLFLLLFLAFGWAERKVYSTYVQAREEFQGNETEHKFARIGGTLRFLFWDLFGMSDLSDLRTDKNFIITQYTGEVLLGLYTIFSIVVAINMLIAMMSNSYQRVADDADIQWKFSRTRMWMPYLDEGNVMPPPFNLIPPPHSVIRLCRRFCADPASFMRGCCTRQDRPASLLKDKVDIKRRRVVMRRLIQRYLLTFENSKKPCQSDAPQLTAERQGDSIELKDLITQLQGILRRREENKCPVNAAKSQPEEKTKVEIHHRGYGTHRKAEKDTDATL
ncbi:short transient receptor potential channel 3-like isoform X1 [Stylophora pistillata]|uniref:short transient receptor potential channel 3-like isoform X1 n=1 Tax=Stylophora pistillata TaxID=50429 RepID=UPI000C04D33B|nr:short transient receptor potential channel 3-like isoform X1 [Stylophora pistillata]